MLQRTEMINEISNFLNSSEKPENNCEGLLKVCRNIGIQNPEDGMVTKGNIFGRKNQSMEIF